MKRVFVCSPFGGKAENTERAREHCRRVIDAGHAPFAPHLLYPQILNDADEAQRRCGLEMGLRFLESCDEVWVFGSLVSAGMSMEIAHAQALGIPTIKFEGERVEGG